MGETNQKGIGIWLKNTFSEVPDMLKDLPKEFPAGIALIAGGILSYSYNFCFDLDVGIFSPITKIGFGVMIISMMVFVFGLFSLAGRYRPDNVIRKLITGYAIFCIVQIVYSLMLRYILRDLHLGYGDILYQHEDVIMTVIKIMGYSAIINIAIFGAVAFISKTRLVKIGAGILTYVGVVSILRTINQSESFEFLILILDTIGWVMVVLGIVSQTSKEPEVRE